MPRIPSVTASPDAPTRTGARRSILGVPNPRFEELDARAAVQVGTAVAQVGQRIRQVGQVISEAQARQRLARDTVQVLDNSTKYIQEMDAFTAEAQQDPDYATLPDRLRQKATELEAQYGQGLSPRASAAFKQRILPHTEGLHRQTLAYVAKTDVARAKTVADELEAVHTRGMLEADSEVRKEYHRIALESGLDSLVAENFLLPEERDARLRKLDETVTIQEAELAIFQSPETASQLIQRRLNGESGGPVFDAVPDSALPELQTKAVQWQNALVSQQRENVRWLEGRQQETQRDNERAMHALLIQTPITPDSVTVLRAYQQEIERRGQDFSPDGAIRLQTLTRSLLDKALEPAPEREDATLVRDLRTAIHLASTPAEVEQAELMVLDSRGALKSDTYAQLLLRVEDRRKAGHYTNDDTYRDGTNIINRAAFVPGLPGIGGLKPPDEIQLGRILALDAFDQKMQELAQTDIRQMRLEARQWAVTYRDLYLPLDKAYTALPANLRDVTSERELGLELQKMQQAGVPKAQLKQLRDLWYSRKGIEQSQAPQGKRE